MLEVGLEDLRGEREDDAAQDRPPDRRRPAERDDALRALEGSTVLREGLGQEVVGSYLKLKRDDWNAYARHLTEWERQTTLDC